MDRRFWVHSLASGSSGNSVLVRSGEAAFLIDAGLSLKALLSALRLHGLEPEDLAGIVQTHEHSDHVQSTLPLARRYGVPVIANGATLARLFAGDAESPHHRLEVGERWSVGDIEVSTFPVPHDAAEPVGVNVIHKPTGQKASLLTDVGHITHTIRVATKGANLLILEANHDVHRLRTGRYPGPLKARILGDRGHLSNEAAAGLMCEHALRHGPHTVWLAHLSKENNTPKLALGYARATLAVETACPVVVDVAKRDKPSVSWTPGLKNLQLSLF